jgi:hypothetical protein
MRRRAMVRGLLSRPRVVRTTRKLALVWLAVALVCSGRHAHARDKTIDEARNAERPTAIALNWGLASVVGVFGVTLTRALDRSFRVEAGAGLGFSGYQLSLMPKAVFFEGRDHVITGAGLAVAFPANPKVSDGHPVWLNVDAIGYEHRFPNGASVSVFAGITYGLGGGNFCDDGIALLCNQSTDKYPVRGQGGAQTRIQFARWF